MGHLMIAVALLAFAGLDVVFVRFSDTPVAALTFAVLSFLIFVILSGSAGSFMAGSITDGSGNRPIPPRPLLGPGLSAVLARIALAAFVPVLLLVLLAYIQEFDDPLNPSETAQLGSTIAVFWLLMSMALTGAVLGFLWPRSGALEAVLVGGMVVLAQSLLSWVKVDASRDALQLALYTWMVWVSICLIGAWVGLGLRRFGDLYLYRAQPNNSHGDTEAQRI